MSGRLQALVGRALTPGCAVTPRQPPPPTTRRTMPLRLGSPPPRGTCTPRTDVGWGWTPPRGPRPAATLPPHTALGVPPGPTALRDWPPHRGPCRERLRRHPHAQAETLVPARHARDATRAPCRGRHPGGGSLQPCGTGPPLPGATVGLPSGPAGRAAWHTPLCACPCRGGMPTVRRGACTRARSAVPRRVMLPRVKRRPLRCGRASEPGELPLGFSSRALGAQRQASGAAKSRSDAGAKAVGGRLHALVGLLGTDAGTLPAR